MKVEAWPQAVHLEEHLCQEKREEQKLCIVWNNNKNRYPNIKLLGIS